MAGRPGSCGNVQPEQVQYVASRKVETRIQSRSFEFSGVAFPWQMMAGGIRPAGISVQAPRSASEPLEPHTMNTTISVPIAAMMPISGPYFRTLSSPDPGRGRDTTPEGTPIPRFSAQGPLAAAFFKPPGLSTSRREGPPPPSKLGCSKCRGRRSRGASNGVFSSCPAFGDDRTGALDCLRHARETQLVAVRFQRVLRSSPLRVLVTCGPDLGRGGRRRATSGYVDVGTPEVCRRA